MLKGPNRKQINHFCTNAFGRSIFSESFLLTNLQETNISFLHESTTLEDPHILDPHILDPLHITLWCHQTIDTLPTLVIRSISKMWAYITTVAYIFFLFLITYIKAQQEGYICNSTCFFSSCNATVWLFNIIPDY